jgi:hypothetical protein
MSRAYSTHGEIGIDIGFWFETRKKETTREK